MKCIAKTLLVGLLLASFHGAAKEEIGKYAQQYGHKTYKVLTVRYGPAKNKEILVQVSGVDNIHDEQIYLHKKKCQNTKCDSYLYETNEILGEKKWWTIQYSKSSWRGIKFYPPGIDKAEYLSSPSRVKDFNPLKFLEKYNAQKKSRSAKAETSKK